MLVGLNADPGIARGAEVKCGRRIGSAPMAHNASVPLFFALQDGGEFHFATLAATLPACGNPEPSPQFPVRFTDPTQYVDRH